MDALNKILLQSDREPQKPKMEPLIPQNGVMLLGCEGTLH